MTTDLLSPSSALPLCITRLGDFITFFKSHFPPSEFKIDVGGHVEMVRPCLNNLVVQLIHHKWN